MAWRPPSNPAGLAGHGLSLRACGALSLAPRAKDTDSAKKTIDLNSRFCANVAVGRAE